MRSALMTCVLCILVGCQKEESATTAVVLEPMFHARFMNQAFGMNVEIKSQEQHCTMSDLNGKECFFAGDVSVRAYAIANDRYDVIIRCRVNDGVWSEESAKPITIHLEKGDLLVVDQRDIIPKGMNVLAKNSDIDASIVLGIDPKNQEKAAQYIAKNGLQKVAEELADWAPKISVEWAFGYGLSLNGFLYVIPLDVLSEQRRLHSFERDELIALMENGLTQLLKTNFGMEVEAERAKLKK